ncbi:MAG TPA: tRNA uridine-5-carboxymethylaminomethyl(34) synthesis enzyme MnmG, partial [Burkholderiaceae bacterium]|nr:tRNA uridine-5-carboxymethylaminomethyl(34) synthesis enzyme MnmG [Burkholderiaceae bacterium]
LGLVDDVRWAAFNRKRDAVAREIERLRSTWVRAETLPDADARRLLGAPIEHEYSLAELLKRPGVDFDAVCEIASIAQPNEVPVSRETLEAEFGLFLADAVIAQAETQLKYAGYIDRQQRDVERSLQFDTLPLPADIDYSRVTALSFEVRQQLTLRRPETLGQAARLPGVTPAAVSLLLVHLKKPHLKGFATAPGRADPEAVTH